MASPITLVVFGPQSPWPNEEQARGVRSSILGDERLASFRRAIEQLPDVWSSLVQHEPGYQRVAGYAAIQCLQRWLKSGVLEHTFNNVPNVLMAPLTVIIHIGAYFQHLGKNGLSHANAMGQVKDSGVQGLCTGLLSAITLASCGSEQELSEKSGVAIRLALAIGACVDLDGDFSEKKMEYVCLAARWKSQPSFQPCKDVLKRYTNAYISVEYDANSVTITVPGSDKESLARDITETGAAVREIELRGRFHSPCLQEAATELLTWCQNRADIQLGGAEILQVPVRANYDAKPLKSGSLTEIVISSLLLRLADWRSTIHAAVGLEEHILAIGYSESIPVSISRRSGIEITKEDGSVSSPPAAYSYPDDAIAIVGMSCQYAGADSLDDLWNIVESGMSMVEKLPESRWSANALRRTSGRTFWGNFLHDADAFDHKFFKASSRAAAAMDPQQRLLLQAAYQAVGSSGLFNDNSPRDDVGCYVGVATTDYHDNIASHKPSAFSALGELRAFLCGRISHYFGWTGPSMTFDTACSASAVAIDAACRALKSGTVSAALAGGVNVCTSPYLYENLMGANFLSPTGQTKPFDVKGDGYCRGEGVGLVFLKRLDVARREGDPILGVIAASAVNQCMNETFITVPHGPSQTRLYMDVLKQSGISPDSMANIGRSVVEAHGTGTQAGDPVEVASIREAIGSTERDTTIHLGSVKGNIGHTEAASGVASLIKATLMMDRGVIPRLASHDTLNPKIPPLESHHMSIPRTTIPWNNQFKAALVNNYGAAGSNGAMIVCQPPLRRIKRTTLNKVPVLISAFSPQSLHAGSQKIQQKLQSLSSSDSGMMAISDVAFNLLDKYQHFPGNAVAGTATTNSEILQLLESPQPNCNSSAKPVVLVFGGQTRDHVGLDLDMIDKVSLFRKYLDAAIVAIRQAGFELHFTDICQKSPVEDVVKLHCMFFAVQYACARSWMAAGLKIEALIGHSFGQLTALCISGRLSVADTIKIVAGRASLIKKLWGLERGSMISLEASLETTSKIVELVAQSSSDVQVEIACLNGPMSHVLVGTESSIECVQKLLIDEVATLGLVRNRVLKVTHGFHSVFTDPLLPALAKIASEVTFQPGSIYLETCSEGSTWTDITPNHIVEHTRTAVHFNAAVKRIAERFGPCTWVEAGGESSVTNMVRKIFDVEDRKQHSFHAVKISSNESLDFLADMTVDLWRSGQKVQFWPFHRVQRKCFTHINLPPYQFDKTKHWLEWKEAESAPLPTLATQPSVSPVPELLTPLSQSSKDVTFQVDPKCEEFQFLVRGHAVLDSPLCPADWYTEIAYRALQKHVKVAQSNSIKSYMDLAFESPLGISPKGQITLAMRRLDKVTETWSFVFSSASSALTGKSTQHCSGKISITSATDPGVEREMARYENLIGRPRALSLLENPNATGLRGSLVYELFSRIVNYAEYYQAVKIVSSVGGEVAAQIVLPERTDLVNKKRLASPIAIDNFVQVAGIKVNCLNRATPNQVYICGHIGRIQESADFDPQEQNSWTVYAHSRPVNNKSYMNDIYVFANSGKLAMVIQDVEFTKVAITSLTRVLTAANADEARVPVKKILPAPSSAVARKGSLSYPLPAVEFSAALADVMETLVQLRQLISSVTDVPVDSIKPESTFDDLGIDSLMNTEVLNAVQERFNVHISLDKFIHLQDIRSLSEYLGRSSNPTTASRPSSDSLSGFVTLVPTPALDTPSDSDDYSTGPSSVQEDDGTSLQPGTFNRLNKLVAELLDINGSVSTQEALGDLGMDSLLSIELCHAIESEFNIDASSIVTTGSLTELHESVRKHSKIANKMATDHSRFTFRDVDTKAKRNHGDAMQTVCFKEVDGVSLLADIYLPDASQSTVSKRPVALMIHGGGHTMLSRKDIRPRQTQLLLENGFLPVSIDYRLSPEINIVDGAMTDVCDALEWCRNGLPHIISNLASSSFEVDTSRIAAIGWSTGGTLALTLGFTALKRGIAPPTATLAFYCPSNYEDPFWSTPNFPENSKSLVPSSYDLLEAVQEVPITGYNVDTRKRAVGGWCSVADPRSRIVLHMNWKGQTLPILLDGLPPKSRVSSEEQESFLSLPQPATDRVVAISPCSQIRLGNYKTPTFLVHSDEDDLVPLQQARDTFEALKSTGVECGISVVDGVPHLFDLYRDKEDGRCWGAVKEGYEFLCKKMFM
ncbi:ketoacyl-synt-domain-containing protein [Amniculicola lignicola CBS 123094]|uniref:Ketoacyl-synt-domain-containing protein n=1 Tax=Amniculicola lignicola CBS 123094 TaxID=1392246 RepID=A0A6A5WT59_9PLEO|nr:ketoacyl-synt-domain-containing protein [Amniculicola lignicola CBS 123094]